MPTRPAAAAKLARVLLLPAAVLLGAAACCPIPMSREYVVVPQASFEVTRGGEPVSGAEVMLVRQMFPHTEPPNVDVRTAATDAGGRAGFAEERRAETVLPLMMHGVHQYGWTWCVSAPGHGAAEGYLLGDAPQEVKVELTGAGSACVEQDGMALAR